MTSIYYFMHFSLFGWIEVSWLSFKMSKLFDLDHSAVVRGSLLHDLFYCDWFREGPRWHGLRHPRIALENARKVTSLSVREGDIILRHMWPLTPIPPRYLESFCVCLADKYCSWRDYLEPVGRLLVGRRCGWIKRINDRFPSHHYPVGHHDGEENSRILSAPSKRRVTGSLNILLIDAQPRNLPFTAFRTLTLPRLAGATPSRHRVNLMDGRVEEIRISSQGVDLVGVSFSCNNASLAYHISKQARKQGIITVAGGTHATAVPQEVLEHFDAVLTGEAEGGAWRHLLDDVVHGSLGERYGNKRAPDINRLSPPRLDLLSAGRYLPAYPVEATRGCPNRCDFCFNRYVHPVYRKRPIDQVAADVMRADRKNIFFIIPYPGTSFYAQLKEEGRLLDLDYRNYTGYRIVVAPKGMSTEELEQGYRRFTREFYSAKSLVNRFRNQKRPPRQLPVYALVNPVYGLPRQAQ